MKGVLAVLPGTFVLGKPFYEQGRVEEIEVVVSLSWRWLTVDVQRVSVG